MKLSHKIVAVISLISLANCLLPALIFGQEPPSVYSQLDTSSYYSVLLSTTTQDGIVTSYTVNDNEVSKEVYEKYNPTWTDIDCCPCVLKSFDENDVLLREFVACTIECGVGKFKLYHPNGEVKIEGQYKENASDDWTNLYDRGICNIRDGKWLYFDTKGDTLYAEFWENNKFIKQEPEQDIPEVWEIGLTLGGRAFSGKIIPKGQVKGLGISLKYKNTARYDKIEIGIRLTGTGRIANEIKFTLDDFKNINVKTFQNAKGKNREIPFSMTIYVDDVAKRSFYLTAI